jgi:hypothetical protein
MAELPAAQPPQSGRTPKAEASRWLDEIRKSQQKHQSWYQRGEKIIKRYRDDREDDTRDWVMRKNRMNILWSNVETLKPALYAQTPVPNVGRRNKDKDEVGRIASIVLERCLSYCLSAYDFDFAMRQCVGDVLLPGRGQAWIKYEPTLGGQPAVVPLNEEGEEDEPPANAEQYLDWEQTNIEYVHWQDFLTNPARVWEDVWWVGNRKYLTRRQLVDKFGEPGQRCSLDAKAPADNATQAETVNDNQFNKATVWTIWSKPDNKVYFISPGLTDEPLGVIDPPSKFEGFFPCPRPLNATLASDSIIPTPDFALYQDQADEIDLMTNRIGFLTRALQVKGVYDSSLGETFATLINDTDNNGLIPADNWAKFSQAGGFKGSVEWLPIDQVASTLQICMEAREASKAALYEVTGIGDVIRGASNPNETATAQSIKSQWGALRIRDRQHEVQRFARDLIRLKAEIIAEHFSQETIAQMSGVKLLTNQQKQMAQMQMQQMQMQQQAMASAAPPGAPAAGMPGQPSPQPPAAPIPAEVKKVLELPTWEQVMGLLRNEKLRGFIIDVETDSTVEPDQQQQQQQAVELLTGVTSFMEGMGKILPAAPGLAPMFGELLLFAVRRFNMGDQVEDVIEQGMQAVEKQLNAPKPPDPQLQVAQIKAKAEETKAQAGMAQSQVDLQKTQIEAQMLPIEAQVAQQKSQAEVMKAQAALVQPPPGVVQ